MAIGGGYQPLNVWHAYEASLRLCFRYAANLILGVALAIVPAQGILLLLMSATVPDALADNFAGSYWDPTTAPEDIPSDQITTWVTGIVIGSFASAFGYVLASAVACVVVSEGWHGRNATWRHAWSVVARRIGPLLWLSLIGGLLVIVGLLLCILPGIWLGVAWCVALPALLFEDVRGTRALERSFRLTRRRWWPTLGGIVLISATGWLMAAPFTIPGFFVRAMTDDFFIGSSIQGTLSILGSLITTPVTASLLTVFFYDLRARQQLEAAAAAPPIAPPPPPSPLPPQPPAP